VTEPSPAERYRRAQARSSFPGLERFRETLSVDLDPFQEHAAQAVEKGRGALVAAPTGAGKTLVAEFAIFQAIQQPLVKVFYTTPMKALSNQKYSELVDTYGAGEVGLLTGDTSINPQARIVIMTTEVLRNMLYANSDLLEHLGYVIMDEVHYLADRFRGAVWEEVIIHLPAWVQLISLSATVSNAEEFGDWLQTVRGDTEVIVSEIRPVPLHQHMMVGERLIPLFRSSPTEAKPQVNPEIVRLVHTLQKSMAPVRRSSRSRSPHRRSYQSHQSGSKKASKGQMIKMLEREDLLPAIFFVFSRAGCDKAVADIVARGVELTTPEEKKQILDFIEERCVLLNEDDLGVLGYHEWVDAAMRGVAAHHAGLLPVFKEVVEELFRRKLLKVVFATETLALGINMPARTVVLEKLEKFNGESTVPITAGEYTQLTGRAGRRGIDHEGHSVIVWHPGMNPEIVAQLASRRSYPLRSSFRPTYNMAVNLIAVFGFPATRDILETSFAQFQADRHVVELAKQVRKNEESLTGYVEAYTCHLGDFEEYHRMRREISAKEKDPSRRDSPRVHAEIDRLRRALKRHPCHGCDEREGHARWADRWWRLERDTEKLRKQISQRTGAIGVVFDRVVAVLTELDYLRSDDAGDYQPTVHGSRLRRIYGERDLLIAECIRRQVWAPLSAPELAGMVAALIHEERHDDLPVRPGDLPPGQFASVLAATENLWEKLDRLERSHRLPGTEPLAAQRSWALWQWATGRDLHHVIDEDDVAVGDFVRLCKQVVDALDHIAMVDEGPVGKNADEAKGLVFRGIVALSSLI